MNSINSPIHATAVSAQIPRASSFVFPTIHKVTTAALRHNYYSAPNVNALRTESAGGAPKYVPSSHLLSSPSNEESAQNAASKPKSKSRLAQLAEDWLEEEEDELQSYWERFDDNKNQQEKSSSSIVKDPTTNVQQEPTKPQEDMETLTTEMRLERYYDSRGINKLKEKQYSSQIQEAISKAQKANTPESAIDAIQAVQPYLQINTRLGGMALYELAIALWQRDGRPDEELFGKLLGNTHVRAMAKRVLVDDRPPARMDGDSFWKGFLGNTWWN